MFKTVVVKKMLSYKVKSDLPGRLRIVFEHYEMLPQETAQYLHYINDAVKMLNGITKVELNILTGSILLVSDKSLNNKKILNWIDTIINEGLAVYEELAKEKLSDRKVIEKKAEQYLKQRLAQAVKVFNEQKEEWL